jgi:PncC family amidohydrolase
MMSINASHRFGKQAVLTGPLIGANMRTTMDKLEETVGRMLAERKLTLATAESCTGGLLGHRITDVPGSSDYFQGGIIAYSYDAKERLLGVHHDTLYEHGAVSPETAIEMARGARKVLGTDVGVSVTGIAGPGGGMPGKPVGLVYIALSSRDRERVEHFVWDSDREGNKVRSADAALAMLKEFLDSDKLG